MHNKIMRAMSERVESYVLLGKIKWMMLAYRCAEVQWLGRRTTGRQARSRIGEQGTDRRRHLAEKYRPSDLH
jgi:hypothetical protein